MEYGKTLLWNTLFAWLDHILTWSFTINLFLTCAHCCASQPGCVAQVWPGEHFSKPLL